MFPVISCGNYCIKRVFASFVAEFLDKLPDSGPARNDGAAKEARCEHTTSGDSCC